MHDVLVVCDDEKEQTRGKAGLHPGYLKPGMTVLDLTASGRRSRFRPRRGGATGCAVVDAHGRSGWTR